MEAIRLRLHFVASPVGQGEGGYKEAHEYFGELANIWPPLMRLGRKPAMDVNLDIFPLLVEQAPDAIIFADRDGVIRAWNGSAAALFGYAPHEAIGHPLDMIIPEHLRHAHWVGFDQAIARGQTKLGRQNLKTRAVPKNGQELFVSLAFAVVKDRQGNAIGAMATAREVFAIG